MFVSKLLFIMGLYPHENASQKGVKKRKKSPDFRPKLTPKPTQIFIQNRPQISPKFAINPPLKPPLF